MLVGKMINKAKEALMMIRVLLVLASIINSDDQAQELLSIWLHCLLKLDPQHAMCGSGLKQA